MNSKETNTWNKIYQKTLQDIEINQEKYLKVFVEEVLRLESPVQSLMRTAAKDITFHGVDIPKGSELYSIIDVEDETFNPKIYIK